MAKVMLVEDDDNLREIYGARLIAEGYEIISAHDGEEALALAVKEKPDLMISDVMMPKISGFDMLDILRSSPDTRNIRIIMMTALSQLEDKDRASKLGADRYLVKSQVTLEDLVKVAREVLDGPGPTDAEQPAEPIAPIRGAAPDPVPTPAEAVPATEPTAPPEPVAEPVAEPAVAATAVDASAKTDDTSQPAQDQPAPSNDPGASPQTDDTAATPVSDVASPAPSNDPPAKPAVTTDVPVVQPPAEEPKPSEAADNPAPLAAPSDGEDKKKEPEPDSLAPSAGTAPETPDAAVAELSQSVADSLKEAIDDAPSTNEEKQTVDAQIDEFENSEPKEITINEDGQVTVAEESETTPAATDSQAVDGVKTPGPVPESVLQAAATTDDIVVPDLSASEAVKEAPKEAEAVPQEAPPATEPGTGATQAAATEPIPVAEPPAEEPRPAEAAPAEPEAETVAVPPPAEEAKPADAPAAPETPKTKESASGMRVIQPINDPTAKTGTDLNNLLAKEQEKSQMDSIIDSAGIGVVPNSDTPAATSNDNQSPGNIAL